jgi:hypothetical protein
MIFSDGPFPAAGRGHAEAGYEAALDKLAAHLAARTAGKQGSSSSAGV